MDIPGGMWIFQANKDDGMTVSILLKDQIYEVESGKSAKESLAEIGMAWQRFLITRAGVLIQGDEILKEGDIIKIVPAVCGG
jgi:sulfur carrier protein ThiS